MHFLLCFQKNAAAESFSAAANVYLLLLFRGALTGDPKCACCNNCHSCQGSENADRAVACADVILILVSAEDDNNTDVTDGASKAAGNGGDDLAQREAKGDRAADGYQNQSENGMYFELHDGDDQYKNGHDHDDQRAEISCHKCSPFF